MTDLSEREAGDLARFWADDSSPRLRALACTGEPRLDTLACPVCEASECGTEIELLRRVAPAPEDRWELDGLREWVASYASRYACACDDPGAAWPDDLGFEPMALDIL